LKPPQPGDGEQKPAAAETGSLLARLWPALATAWPVSGEPMDEAGEDPLSGWRQPVLRRLPGGWQRPASPARLDVAGESVNVQTSLVPYDWASSWAMHAGAVAHRWLQHIATLGVENFAGDEAALRRLHPAVRRMLVRAGVDSASIDRAVERVHAVLANTLADERGRWVLSASHAGAVNEWPLTVRSGDHFRHLVIDRSFVCEQGMRWIIDYKTSSHEGGDRAQFIASESLRYAPQLQAYRQAFAALETRTIRTALYFPLLRLLQPVDASPVVAGSGSE
jgi:hypothetical protein